MGKPILFLDWNGTLNHDVFFRSLDAHTLHDVEEYLFRANESRVREWMLGKHTSEDIVADLAHHLAIPFDDLWDIFVDDCATMGIDPLIRKRLMALKPRYTLVLVTGNMDCFTRYTVPNQHLTEVFDHISSSHEEGMMKTDNEGALFARYCTLLGAQRFECHVYDDSPEVCAVAKKLGMHAHRITGPASLEEALEELG